MEAENVIQKGFDLACNYLGYCNRTEHEIKEYLKKKSFDDSSITKIISKLKQYNYINDENYIRNMIKSNYNGNRYGKKRILEQLKKRGIEERSLNWVTNNYPDRAEQHCAAFHLKKAIDQYKNEDTYIKRKQKITAYMIRKGFNYADIQPLLYQADIGSYEARQEKNSSDQLAFFYQKYYQMQLKKGYSGYELKRRIFNNLLSRGYHYDEINQFLSEKESTC